MQLILFQLNVFMVVELHFAVVMKLVWWWCGRDGLVMYSDLEIVVSSTTRWMRIDVWHFNKLNLKFSHFTALPSDVQRPSKITLDDFILQVFYFLNKCCNLYIFFILSFLKLLLKILIHYDKLVSCLKLTTYYESFFSRQMNWSANLLIVNSMWLTFQHLQSRTVLISKSFFEDLNQSLL